MRLVSGFLSIASWLVCYAHVFPCTLPTCTCTMYVYIPSAVIDLSSIEPENLGPLHLEQIPLCSFTEKGRPYKPKAKKNKKKWRKDEEHRAHKKAEGQDGERVGKRDGGDYRQVRTVLQMYVCICANVCTCMRRLDSSLYVYVQLLFNAESRRP